MTSIDATVPLQVIAVLCPDARGGQPFAWGMSSLEVIKADNAADTPTLERYASGGDNAPVLQKPRRISDNGSCCVSGKPACAGPLT